MKIVRLKKGRNDFAIANLTLAHLRLIDFALTHVQEHTEEISEDFQKVLDCFKQAKLPTLELFGEDLVVKVRPVDWVKKSEREPKHSSGSHNLRYSVVEVDEERLQHQQRNDED